MKPDSDDTRNATALATSSGFPTRRTMDLAAICSESEAISEGERPCATISVTMNPGAMALTVMPCGPSCMAKRRVSTETAALVAA